MPALASFRTFLETGTLGPLRPGMTMAEVAMLLGPPEDWLDWNELSYPMYWRYGEFGVASLEIAYEREAPYRIPWFQIEHPALDEEVHPLGPRLSLTSDGLQGMTKLSDFLKTDLWKEQDIRIHHIPISGFTIVAGALTMTFALPDDMEMGKTALTEALGNPERCRYIDDQSWPIDIYSNVDAIDIARRSVASCSREEYLRALAGDRR